MNDSEEPQRQYQPTPVGVWVFLTIIASGLLVWRLAVLLNDKQYDYIQAVVLTLTLLAIVWYTFETNKMQRAMARQTTISILPLFNVSIVIKYGARPHWEASSRYNVFLQNIGNGVGLNIEIDPLYVKHDSDGLEKIDKLWFPRIVHLSPEDKPIAIKDIIEFDEYLKRIMVTDEGRPDLLEFLRPEKIKDEYEMKLRYMDVLGNQYVQVIHFDKSGNWPGKAIPVKSNEKTPASHQESDPSAVALDKQP